MDYPIQLSTLSDQRESPQMTVRAWPFDMIDLSMYVHRSRTFTMMV